MIVKDERAIDVERASKGRFGADPQAIFESWDEFREWADGADDGGEPFEREQLGPPVPRPRQVYAIGLNYVDHASESGLEAGEPVVFTKYQTCLAGPYADVVHPVRPGGGAFPPDLGVSAPPPRPTGEGPARPRGAPRRPPSYWTPVPSPDRRAQ